MDLKTLVAVFLKISGLGMVVWAVLQAASAIPFLVSAPDTYLLPYMPTMLIPLFIGGALWFAPLKIANTIIKDAPLVENTDRFLRGLERAAIALMGLYLLYRGLSDLVFHLSYEQRMFELLGQGHQRTADRHASLIMSYFEIALSLVFILGAKTIVIALRKAWELGRRWPE